MENNEENRSIKEEPEPSEERPQSIKQEPQSNEERPQSIKQEPLSEEDIQYNEEDTQSKKVDTKFKKECSKSKKEGTKSKKEDSKSKKDSWRLHNIYGPGVSCNRIVTRSQTAFNRIKNTKSDLDLFADADRHQPPGMPHLMVTMKGEYGAIPNTIITRSTGKHLSVSKELCEKLIPYKEYKPGRK